MEEKVMIQLPVETIERWKVELNSMSHPTVEYDASVEKMKDKVIREIVTGAENLFYEMKDII